MTFYNQIKDKLNNGSIIYAEKFSTGETVYSIRTIIDESSRTVHCEIAYNIAKMLEKETGSTIVISEQESVALNFKPTPVQRDCVRTFHDSATQSYF